MALAVNRSTGFIVGFAFLLIAAKVLPDLAVWPSTWVLPVNDWINSALAPILQFLKPAARLFADLMALPMAGTKWLFTSLPWVSVFAIVIAFAWWVGHWRMGLLAIVALLMVLLSGYWVEAMNTLSLVAVSVPLALLLGLSVGLLAFEVRPVRRWVEGTLDMMQTVPTFAYLLPLLVLFGFGPVVGLIASAIYAAPPMARNVLLGLERVDPEIREAARMAGATRLQQIALIELPAAKSQIMVGFNQCIMAALSMVIIAAVIGGFEDIGWEVLLTMRKAQFGQSLLAGMVIVLFAVLIDRTTAQMARSPQRYNARPALLFAVVGGGLGVLLSLAGGLPDAGAFAPLERVADWVDASLGAFVSANGKALDSFKNTAVFYAFLPLRIGLDGAVLPFTWGFAWTPQMSQIFLGAAAVTSVGVALVTRSLVLGSILAVALLTILIGVTQVPWVLFIFVFAYVGFVASGWRLALFITVALLSLALSGLWDRAMLSTYLCLIAVATCVVLGGAIGLASALNKTVWRVVEPIADMLQTIPLFVFLIPVLMLFQIGEFSAFLAIIAYAIVPMVRYTRHGVISTPPELREAAQANGATPLQTLIDVRIPFAVPSILLGLNQTILYAFAMLVITALIGTTGLGQSIYLALGKGDLGMGLSAGAAMALLAIIADRIVQGFAEKRREALGL